MTKEEAITREEAIRRIKAWNLDSDDMEVLSVAIPELAESEDERIRKELMLFLSDIKRISESGRTTWAVRKEDAMLCNAALAYLEKQKEQKPFPKFRIGDRMRTKQEALEGITDGMPVIISIDDTYYYCTNEKIPIAEQDEYEYPTVNIELKPAEWSEEVERIRKIITDSVFYQYGAGAEYKDVLDYLDKLEKQKEQSFTHHEINESLRDAVTHQMEDDGDVDDFVRRGIDDIALKYAALGAKWQKEMEIDVKDYRLRDTWEYIDEFIKKFGRVPKDIDELSACVDYVIKHKFIDEKKQKPVENIPQLTVQGKGVYKICPRCKERMVRDDSKVYTSMPPQYGYECPKCGKMEFDTVMYDSPEMEKQKPVQYIPYTPDSVWQKIKSAITDCKKLSEHYKDTEENFYQYYGGKAEGLQLALDYLGDENELPLKEQKHVECIEFNNEFENQVSHLLASVLNGEHEYSNGFIKYAAQSLLGQAKNELNLTKWNDVTINGKPIPTENQSVDIPLANWSEEDKEALDMCYELLLKAEYTLIDKGYFGSVQFIKDWLKSLPERFVLQSKHEWSEEDERMLSRCVKSIESSKQFADSDTFKKAKDNEIDWLENCLNSLPKQEWGEEDEKIRKALCEVFKGYPLYGLRRDDILSDIRIVDILDWLEKQKYNRMKPIYDARESFESALEKAWNDYHNGYENVDKLEDDYVENAHAKGFREGYLFGIEKQKEQKPAKWSEEDAKVLNDIVVFVSGYADKRVVSRWVEFLKSLRPKKNISYGELPLVSIDYMEGLDTDFEKQVGAVIASAMNREHQFTSKYIKWTAQQLMEYAKDKQNSEEECAFDNKEWSEEEERILDSLIRLYSREYSANAWPWADGVITYGDVVNFLNSLKSQPHWKPSEEEMEAFKKYIEEFQARAEAAVGGWNNFDIMIRLYEQLKNLV